MSMEEIDNDNATRGHVYTKHTIQIHTKKSIEHINQQQQAWGIDKYANVTRIIQTGRKNSLKGETPNVSLQGLK